MGKIKTVFYCKHCGHESHSWIGKCPACSHWNTYVETVRLPKDTTASRPRQNNKPLCLEQMGDDPVERLASGLEGLDTLLGGGIVRGSLVLVGGEPGIGKSTLLMQMALRMTAGRVLYVSGEESPQQVKMRAKRIGDLVRTCYLVGETCLESVIAHAKSMEPAVLMVDSIQTLHSAKIESSAGSMLQIRECTAQLMQYSKASGTATFIVGHITKEGLLAGPKVLEHMVDTVLQFEGDGKHMHRLLRVIKNRFGPAGALGVYEMAAGGLKKVQNPSQFFLQKRDEAYSGVAIASVMEGNHPFLIEVQSLVSKATYTGVQRVCTGFDGKRLNMLLAMLEKKRNFPLSSKDVFLNMTGGIRVEDPAVDLAVCVCIISSLYDKALPNRIIFAAEVGLGGELRPISHAKKRIEEAEKLGFQRIYIPKMGIKEVPKAKVKVSAAKTLLDVIQDLFALSEGKTQGSG